MSEAPAEQRAEESKPEKAEATAPAAENSDTDVETNDGDEPVRWNVTPSTRRKLEAQFKKDPYPKAEDRARLAEELKVTQRQIQIWFQNRRQRARKPARGKRGARGARDAVVTGVPLTVVQAVAAQATGPAAATATPAPYYGAAPAQGAPVPATATYYRGTQEAQACGTAQVSYPSAQPAYPTQTATATGVVRPTMEGLPAGTAGAYPYSGDVAYQSFPYARAFAQAPPVMQVSTAYEQPQYNYAAVPAEHYAVTQPSYAQAAPTYGHQAQSMYAMAR